MLWVILYSNLKVTESICSQGKSDVLILATSAIRDRAVIDHFNLIRFNCPTTFWFANQDFFAIPVRISNAPRIRLVFMRVFR